MWRRNKNLFAEEQVTVTVDEISAKATLDAIETARRKLEAVIAEAKTERGKLEAAVATARRKGQGRW